MAIPNEDSVDLPIAVVHGNGVPKLRKFENTGEVHKAVSEVMASNENPMEALANLILSTQAKGGGGGGGGDAGAKVLKDIKKHKWLAGLLALILGPGGMTATYYAIKDRGLSNERNIHQMQKAVDEGVERHKLEGEEIRLIKVDVSKINSSIKQADQVHGEMLDGIKSLQKVNVDRLEKENARLERQLDRARGGQ